MSDAETIMVVLQRINRSLDAMAKAPRMWGSQESLELQALLLLEMKCAVLRPGEESFIRDAYEAFIKDTFEDPPATLLSCILHKAGRGEELSSHLQRFRLIVEERLACN